MQLVGRDFDRETRDIAIWDWQCEVSPEEKLTRKVRRQQMTDIYMYTRLLPICRARMVVADTLGLSEVERAEGNEILYPTALPTRML